MSSKLLLAIFLSISMVGFAKAAEHVWFEGSIKRLYPTANGNFIVMFDENNAECTSGSNPKYHYVNVGVGGVTAEGSDKMYAGLMAAAVAGKRVSINFDRSVPQCYIRKLQVIF